MNAGIDVRLPSIMLNKAHLLHRQAEKASRKGRVEEAIQLHKEAADILRDLLQTIINDKVRINFYVHRVKTS